MKRLAGKSALVTGGSRGIGAAIAMRLGEEGAKVGITYVSSPDRAEAVVSALREKGVEAEAMRADAADAGAVAEAVHRAVARFGGLDVLVNNAGIFEMAPLPEVSDAAFERMYNINVRAVFVASREAARVMNEGGRIITIGSVNGDRMPFPGGSLYAMSKAAVAALTKGWARDLGPKGITVNCVQPGPIDTELNPANGDFAAALTPMTALGRFGEADEVAALVAFLATPESAYITGASLNVDGGFNA